MAVNLIAELCLLRDEKNRSDSDTLIVETDSDTTLIPLDIDKKPLDENEVNNYAEKFVSDVLDYCHRRDFPYALIFTAVDLITKTLTTADNSDFDANAPLKSLTQNDTTFQFAVAEIDTNADLYESLFYSVKSKLNLYRKARCL